MRHTRTAVEELPAALAEQHDGDVLAATIDNLGQPIRDGRITLREALMRVARAGFHAGWGAGYRAAREAP